MGTARGQGGLPHEPPYGPQRRPPPRWGGQPPYGPPTGRPVPGPPPPPGAAAPPGIAQPNDPRLLPSQYPTSSPPPPAGGRRPGKPPGRRAALLVAVGAVLLVLGAIGVPAGLAVDGDDEPAEPAASPSLPG